jgi:hypothetical protein
MRAVSHAFASLHAHMGQQTAGAACMTVESIYHPLSNPLELSRRARYILPVHTTHRGCPETLILMLFSWSLGPWQRIPPSPPVVTFAASDRHKVSRLMVTRCILLACRFSHSAANLLTFLTAVSAQLVLPSQLGFSRPPRFPASV